MDEEKKTFNPVNDPERPKQGWDTGGCPWIIFADDDAAEYDLDKIKKFFNRFKKKTKHKR